MRKQAVAIAIAGLLMLPALVSAQAAAPADPPAKDPDAAAPAAPVDPADPDAAADAPADDPAADEAEPAADAAPPAADAAPAAAAPAAADPAPAAAAAPAADAKPTDIPDVGGAGDLSAYGVSEDDVPPGGRMEWAERRQIRVIQKRAILKESRHQFTLFGGVVPNDDFFAYIAGGLGYNYYFTEDISLDISGAYTGDVKTSLEGSLTEGRPEGPSLKVRLPQTLEGYLAVAATWNLLHGKLGFFQTRLTEFDFGVIFGIGANSTIIKGKGMDELARKIDANGNIGLAGMFYLSRNWALRVDYRQFFYPKEGGGVSFPIATTVGLSYFTTAPE